MQFISEDIVSLKPIPTRFIFFTSYDEVWINGKNTRHLIKEHCLNACVKVDSLYILFTTDVFPCSDFTSWSETSSWDDHLTWSDAFKLSIYLFNEAGDMLDQSCIDVQYHYEYPLYEEDERYFGGYLSKFKLIPPNIITFLFGGKIWTLKLLKKPVPFTEELYRRGLGLLDKPRRHGIIKRLFCFLTKHPLGSQPKNLHKTYFDLSVKIIK